MARRVIEAQVGGVIERFEAALDAINDARVEAAALARELPAMLPGERLAAERRQFALRREIAAHAAGLGGDGTRSSLRETPDLGVA